MNTILTPLQIIVFEALVKESTLLKSFYWTGGTVLSEYYLHHRLSEDIDLFSEEEVNVSAVNSLITKVERLTGAQEIKYTNYLGLRTYFLSYGDVGSLKIDFNYYPFPRINRGAHFKGISYDSYLDILVNKIQTVYTKPRGRDFVDLYFANKKEKLDLKELIKLSKAKFDWNIDPLQLATQFMRAESLYESPKLLIPINMDDFIGFFNSWVLELKSQAMR